MRSIIVKCTQMREREEEEESLAIQDDAAECCSCSEENSMQKGGRVESDGALNIHCSYSW